jgi:hypothetical protein
LVQVPESSRLGHARIGKKADDKKVDIDSPLSIKEFTDSTAVLEL